MNETQEQRELLNTIAKLNALAKEVETLGQEDIAKSLRRISLNTFKRYTQLSEVAQG